MIWARLKLCHAVLTACRNPADMGGRMLTFTYVAVLSGLVAWSTIGTAESILQRLGVSHCCSSACGYVRKMQLVTL